MTRTPKPPNFRTERLLLRQPRAGDEEELLPIRNLPRTLTAVNMTASTIEGMRRSLAQVADETERGTAYSAVIELSTRGVVIGLVRLENAFYGSKASLVVWVSHEVPVRNCGSEAAGAMVLWGFEHLALRLILAEVFGSNAASASMLTRLGFVQSHVETARQTHLGLRLVTKYSLRRDGWASLDSAQPGESPIGC